jgi:MFS family permease
MTIRSIPLQNRRWWALGALALSVLVVGLDLFVLTLALPTLSADLHASTSDLQWFVDAYSLVLAAALLPAGLLGDRYGRKKLLITALVLFAVASLACAYSSSSGELIAARALLGLAAAVILPLSLAVIPVLFSAEERPKAIAAVGGATFLGFPIGPVLGGWLLDHFWWGSVFLINVPVVVIALVAVTLLMPESRSNQRPRMDIVGVVISSAGLIALTYGAIKAGQNGWSDTTAVTMMAGGVVLLAAFAAWERAVGRRPSGPPETAGAHAGKAGRAAAPTQPLVDLTLFRSAGFTWGTILATMVSFALYGIIFAMPQYFLDVRGLNSLGAGVRLLPLVAGLAVGLGIGQRLLTPRKAPGGGPSGAPPVSAKVVAASGFAIMAVALAIGAGTSVRSGTGFAAAWFGVTGLGLGFAMPTALNAALGALSPERSGSGSAVITAMRQVGGTVGVAVLGTILASAYRAHLTMAGLPAAAAAAVHASVAGGIAVGRAAGSAPLLAEVRTAYVHGMDVMLWACSGIALAAALLALAFLPRRADAPAAAAAEAPAAAGPAGGDAGPREAASAE